MRFLNVFFATTCAVLATSFVNAQEDRNDRKQDSASATQQTDRAPRTTRPRRGGGLAANLAAATVSNKIVQIDLTLLRANSADQDSEKDWQELLQTAKGYAGKRARRGDGAFTDVDQVRLSSMSGKKCTIESGSQTAMASGVATSRGGQKIYNYNTVSTGLQVVAVPRVTDDGIEIDLKVTRTYISPADSDDDAEEGIFTPDDIKILQSETTVSVKNGEPIAFGANEVAANQTWIIVVSANTTD